MLAQIKTTATEKADALKAIATGTVIVATVVAVVSHKIKEAHKSA